jgi:hypothetical protein
MATAAAAATGHWRVYSQKPACQELERDHQLG